MGAEARVREQAVDQTLHAVRAIDREMDITLRVFVELVFVALNEQTEEARDHTQRLTQVVRCYIRKLFEIAIAARERFFAALAFGHLDDRHDRNTPGRSLGV